MPASRSPADHRSEIDRFVDELLARQELRGQAIHRHIVPAKPPEHADPSSPLPGPLAAALRGAGVGRLYTHQVEALEAARAGANVLLVTGTASGKSLGYQLPVLEAILADPSARALFLFPIKALEQDQRKSLEALIPFGSGIRAEIMDGDTPSHRRAKLRADPPHILITNPDILHLSLLPGHEQWPGFFTHLKYVVVDELHTYKGIFGSHVAHVLRRLRRVVAAHGARPQFVACSATIANPAEFAGRLFGLPFHLVESDGAPRREKSFLLINPTGSPYGEATDLLLRLVRKGFKTIAFAKARKIAELITMWAREADATVGGKLRTYRAGYRPEERRAIERGLFAERLGGVVSTSALELGIDVGGLDACLLVGYPGSIASTWQRGGRVGRGGREALIILVALPDALDQYFCRHPEDFFGRGFEAAIVDPGNRQILAGHLESAADEIPLRPDEARALWGDVTEAIHELAGQGRLNLSGDGTEWYARRRRPQRLVNIRGIGESFAILGPDGGSVGTVDGGRALSECHPGAIYLHQGRQYEVTALDLAQRNVRVQPVTVDYYTQSLATKETEILETFRFKEGPAFTARVGRLKVTAQVTGYDKRRIHGQDKLASYPLELPPVSFETVGTWLELPEGLPGAVGGRGLHFMGGIHAAEHAMIALLPLFALCDREDVGGISIPLHPQVGRPAIFIYDGYPGGIGLAERGYDVLEPWMRETLRLLQDCPCESGCPSCVQSPKCGSGNRPLDKAAAIFLLEVCLGDRHVPALRAAGALDGAGAGRVRPLPGAGHDATPGPVLILDVETRRSAEEVGGWDQREKMGLAVAVAYDVEAGLHRVYLEGEVDALLEDLRGARLVVGFNVKRFDYGVLRGYLPRPTGRPIDLAALPTLDLLEEVHARLGFRLSLAHLAQETLGVAKTADGLQSLQWVKAGELDKVIAYCKADVEITRDLYAFGRTHGYLLYRDARGRPVRVPVDFAEKLVARPLAAAV